MKIEVTIPSTRLMEKPVKMYTSYFLLAGILLISVLMPPFHEGGFTVCLFKNAFSIPCPGCGMTRAILFLGHGDICEAITLNPNSLLVFLIIGCLWLNKTIQIFTGKSVKVQLTHNERIMVYVMSGFLMITVWIYNLALNPWV